MTTDNVEVKITQSAFDILARARRETETLSDVIIRLSASTLEGLQRRGEKEISTYDGKRLIFSIDQDKCLGAMSCVSVAPSVFAYDTTQSGIWRRQAQPLGMKEVREGELDSETLHIAAESCPYRAIILKDAVTGEVLVQ